LPLETRDQNSFVTLTAGAVQGNVALNANNGGTDRGAAVDGTRSGSGNYLVEGFDITIRASAAADRLARRPVVPTPPFLRTRSKSTAWFSQSLG